MDNEHEYLQKTLKILLLVHREEDGGTISYSKMNRVQIKRLVQLKVDVEKLEGNVYFNLKRRRLVKKMEVVKLRGYVKVVVN